MLMENDDDIDRNLVEEIKEQYYYQTYQNSAKGNASPTIDSMALKAARICSKHGVDPAVFLAAQLAFTAPPKGKTEVYPSQLAGDERTAMKNVNEFRVRSSTTDLKASWNYYKKYLRGALQAGRPLEDILLDHNYSFPAWFRCLITAEPIPAVIKKYGYAASQELKSTEITQFIKSLATLPENKVVMDLERIPKYWL